ncbi:MAG: DUF898 domain-containing protein [Clostridiales bacterium]|nr:DUF898 domain-containing protein [Clostridiales bacterium]
MADKPTQRVKRSLRSTYNGTAGSYFLLRLGCLFLSLIPFIGLPNAICILERYKCRNTEIVGMPLEFNGKAGDLLGRMFVWGFFTVITIGIYGLFVLPIRYQQWKTSHTVFGPIIM